MKNDYRITYIDGPLTPEAFALHVVKHASDGWEPISCAAGCAIRQSFGVNIATDERAIVTWQRTLPLLKQPSAADSVLPITERMELVSTFAMLIRGLRDIAGMSGTNGHILGDAKNMAHFMLAKIPAGLKTKYSAEG